jgi:stearoyl-CoA desaturase (Delta-9 desaturase)
MRRRPQERVVSRTHKIVNLIGIVGPLVGLFAAIGLLWDRMVGPTQLVMLAVGYVLTGLGVTVGYHRLFTHRSFQTYPVIRYAFAVLGQLAIEGTVITWVADHRKHHQFSDHEGDPHSPHAGFGDGVRGALRGLWHAHTGWLFSLEGRAEQSRYAKDLLQDRGMRIIAKLFGPMIVASLLIPALIGWALIGGWYGFISGLVWGGAIRIFLLHHVTFSINSICHFWGRRRFRSEDESRNVWWLSWISFGESWHNNHHAFPTSAYHGLRPRELDPGALAIWTMEKLGLAWQVVRIAPEKQARKLVATPSS